MMTKKIFDLSMELCRVRDDLREMTEASYQGSYAVLKPIAGSSSKYSSKVRKTTLAEARKRIQRSIPRLNAIINAMVEHDTNNP
jgi:hypothetical protein